MKREAPPLQINGNRVENSTVVLGHNNIVVQSDDSLDWQKLMDSFSQAMARCSPGSEEYILLNRGLCESAQKNKSSFLRFLRQHSGQFLSGVAQNALGAGAAAYLASLL